MPNVTFDAASSATAFTGATSVSWSHTVGASLSNSILLVEAGDWNIGATTVSSVTFGGVNLTLVPSSRSAATNGTRTEMWYILNPTAGAGTIQINFAAAADGEAGAQSFSNVHQTTPFGTAVATTGTGTAISLSPAGGVAGDMAVDVVSFDGTFNLTMTAQTGRVQRFNAKTGQGGAASTMPDPASPQAMAWTLSASGDFAESAVVIKQSSGAAAVIPPAGPWRGLMPLLAGPI